MYYPQYFKTGQKILLKATVQKPTGEQRFDSLFAMVTFCETAQIEISFPPPFQLDADFPFLPGQEIEMLSDHQGMGVSVRTEFIKRTGAGNLQLKFLGELGYFNRRRHHRVDVDIWLGLEESAESLSVLRGKWQQLVEHFRGDQPSPHLADFSKREISLSSNGLGLRAQSPAPVGAHFMIFMALADDLPTICILGEVVRSQAAGKDGFDIGVHFDCIEETDRQRIEKSVNQHRRQAN